MIALNEEAFIGKCLRRVKPYVDEIIVVDGGSTDRTVEIARRHGAKIHHHKWPGHFAKQRNRSLKYATGEWIVQVDPDETWSFPLLKKLRQLVRDAGQVDMFIFRERHYIDKRFSTETKQLKLFRNNGQIKFQNRLHEQPVGWKFAGYPPNLLVYHYKTSSRQAEQNKRYDRIGKLRKPRKTS